MSYTVNRCVTGPRQFHTHKVSGALAVAAQRPLWELRETTWSVVATIQTVALLCRPNVMIRESDAP